MYCMYVSKKLYKPVSRIHGGDDPSFRMNRSLNIAWNTQRRKNNLWYVAWTEGWRCFIAAAEHIFFMINFGTSPFRLPTTSSTSTTSLLPHVLKMVIIWTTNIAATTTTQFHPLHSSKLSLSISMKTFYLIKERKNSYWIGRGKKKKGEIMGKREKVLVLGKGKL